MLDNEWGISQFPLVPGHEAVGTIVALGEHAKGLNIGQRVAVDWTAYSCFHVTSTFREITISARAVKALL